MHRDPSKSPLVRWRQQHRALYDSIVLVVYLLAVYVWALGVPALGRDYALLEHPQDPVIGALVAAFGAAPVPYHLVNLALLYACMLLVYRLTNRVVQGPQWLGNLAAVLFMANPVHTEAVVNLTGASDLLPALAALAALTAYAWTVADPRPIRWVVVAVLFFVAAVPFPGNTFLFLVAALLEWLVVRRPGTLRRMALPLAAGAVAVILHGETLLARGFHPAESWVPLYFLFYPLGFLPETVYQFQQRPWLGWLAALTVAAVCALIYRKARHPAILFGIVAMLALRLFPLERAVDHVHLVGGGQLLVENALFNIALVALFVRVMDHPRWRAPVVAGTTVLAVVFFALQIRSNLAWKRAGEEVRAFQREAARIVDDTGGPVGVLPDYRHHITAPVRLSESISYDTPFSRALPHVSLLPLNLVDAKTPAPEVLEWTPAEGLLAIDRASLPAALTPDFGVLEPGAVVETAGALIDMADHPDAVPDRVVLRLRPRHVALPPHTAPARR